MKILAIGDMHLGRRPSRLPSELAEQARELGPSGAWRRAVSAAIEAGVRAVLLAGDVVEKEDDFFEAYRDLAAGVKRLAEAGIAVVGVAGNHDVKVLPRLAAQIPEFRLLGQGGQWEHCVIEEGSESATLWGWSFPQAKVQQSPLQDEAFERQPGLNLGILHCDRDAGASPYAPVTGVELERVGLDGWLLGHIHKPDALTAQSPYGYLGSLTALSRRESGVRGPWLMTVERGALGEVKQLPLAPLRWESLDVDIGDINEPTEAKDILSARLREFDKGFENSVYRPEAVGLHLRLTGRTRLGNAALKEFTDQDRGHVPAGTSNRHYFIHRLSVDTRPEVELAALVEKEINPLGLLAQRLLWLQEPEGHPERDHLVNVARERLAKEANKPIWKDLEAVEQDPVDWLTEAGFRALDQLLAQPKEVD